MPAVPVYVSVLAVVSLAVIQRRVGHEARLAAEKDMASCQKRRG